MSGHVRLIETYAPLHPRRGEAGFDPSWLEELDHLLDCAGGEAPDVVAGMRAAVHRIVDATRATILALPQVGPGVSRGVYAELRLSYYHLCERSTNDDHD